MKVNTKVYFPAFIILIVICICGFAARAYISASSTNNSNTNFADVTIKETHGGISGSEIVDYEYILEHQTTEINMSLSSDMQTRLQNTLMEIDGIIFAKITLIETDKGLQSILAELSLSEGKELSDLEQIAIKEIIANAITNIEVENIDIQYS